MEDSMGFFGKKTENYDEYTEEDKDFGNDGYGYEDDTMANDFEADPQPVPAEPEAFAPAAPALKIVNPKEYKDAIEIANLLINGNTILLNIESIAKDQAIRLLDYLNGAVHVAGGIMTKVSKTTIVIAPKNVDVSSIEAMVSGD
ncbi:MAG: cell division protein SepF [Ruminococcaceae bacterium]|nr:cell division protein SepF [Oscillospiraceae bacterium]